MKEPKDVCDVLNNFIYNQKPTYRDIEELLLIYAENKKISDCKEKVRLLLSDNPFINFNNLIDKIWRFYPSINKVTLDNHILLFTL